MLKHQIIVDRLSELQKIQILTDVRKLSAPEYIELGIPEFKISSLKGDVGASYQTPNSMANSWNLRAIAAYSEEIASAMSADNVNIVSLPSPIPKLNLADEAISEDSLLSSRIVATCLSSVKSKGLGTILDGAYLDENDVSKLDKEPNRKFVNEFVVRALNETMVNRECDGVVVGSDIDAENYEHINTQILMAISGNSDTAFGNSRILCKNIAQEETVAKIVRGYICLDGSETVLKTAVDRYKRLQAGMNTGKVSVCELEAEIENGTAFPPEEIDKAVDRVIDFVFSLVSNYRGRASSNSLNYGVAKSVAQESIVLLKNDKNILPLNVSSKKKSTVAFVGDIIANYDAQPEPNFNRVNELLAYAGNQGISSQGFFYGYAMYSDRTDNLVDALSESLKDVSTVVLFMGTNRQKERIIPKTENLYLPANQIAALDKIRKMGKKIIAVVSSDHSFDVTFADKVDALLIAPLNVREGLEAVVDVISGKVSPSGKLAYSLYENTENILVKQQYYLDMPNSKVGPFIGYRYYDSAGYDMAYPFGFGLSFSKFAYSGLSVQGSNVTFTVKNQGKYPAAEVVQVYVGFNKMSERHPKRELAGFEKVFLQPGASTTVTIPLAHVEIFDSNSGRWAVERGDYTVYVGSSLTDVRLSAKIKFGNDTFEDTSNDLFNYLQSETNIISENYTLEANYKLMKKNVRNIAFGIGSLILAISMFIFSLSTGTVAPFLVAVASILAISSAIFFILEGTDRKKLHEQEREMVNAANKDSFKDADVIPAYSTNQVFANEFDKAGKEAKASASPMRTKAANHLEFVNESLTFDIAVEQFISFAMARGYKVEEDTARSIFSAMSASRLIITSGITNDYFAVMIKLLSDYFETGTAIDMVDSSYENDKNTLFKFAGTRKYRTALMNTLLASQAQRAKVHISALTEVRFAELSNYFVPYARYIRNPRNITVIQTSDENNNPLRINLSENVWFIMNLSMNESLKNIPAYIAELASYVKIEYTATAPVPLNDHIIPFSYYQFDYLLECIKTKNGISEESWKKIDAVESFVNSGVSYTIGNRVSIAVERFFAVYKACGGEDKDALDIAMSARIIPSAIASLDSVEDSDKKNLSDKLDAVFGEENIEASRAVIRSSGSSVL